MDLESSVSQDKVKVRDRIRIYILVRAFKKMQFCYKFEHILFGFGDQGGVIFFFL